MPLGDRAGMVDMNTSVTRGAGEFVVTATADAGAGTAPADGEFRHRYLAENQRLGQQGLRVIAGASC